MTVHESPAASEPVNRTRTMRVPRTRGAVSGVLLILLGAWGALVPFIGAAFDYSYGSDQTWQWTAARGWLEVLPGAAAVVGGWLVLLSRDRVRGSVGGWLAAAAGAWFVIGQFLAPVWHLGDIGAPLSARPSGQALAHLGYFFGLGAVIVFLAAFALGRLAVVGVRDLAAAARDDERAAEANRRAELERQRAVDAEVQARQAAERDAAERAAAERAAAERAAAERSTADKRIAAEHGRAAELAAADTPAGRAADGRPADYNPADGNAGHAPTHSAEPTTEPERPFDSRP